MSPLLLVSHLSKLFTPAMVSSSLIFQNKLAAFSTVVFGRSSILSVSCVRTSFGVCLTSYGFFLCSASPKSLLAPLSFFPVCNALHFSFEFSNLFCYCAPNTILRRCFKLVSKVPDAVLNQIERHFRKRNFPPFPKFLSIHL